MDGMRKVVWFLFAMMLAAIALPSPRRASIHEAVQSYVDVEPVDAVDGGGAPDEQGSRPGNSNIGSFKLTFTGAN